MSQEWQGCDPELSPWGSSWSCQDEAAPGINHSNPGSGDRQSEEKGSEREMSGARQGKHQGAGSWRREAARRREAREWGLNVELEVDWNVRIRNDRQGLEWKQWLWAKRGQGGRDGERGAGSSSVESWKTSPGNPRDCREGCVCGTEPFVGGTHKEPTKNPQRTLCVQTPLFVGPLLQGWSSSGDTTGVEKKGKERSREGTDMRGNDKK